MYLSRIGMAWITSRPRSVSMAITSSGVPSWSGPRKTSRSSAPAGALVGGGCLMIVVAVRTTWPLRLRLMRCLVAERAHLMSTATYCVRHNTGESSGARRRPRVESWMAWLAASGANAPGGAVRRGNEGVVRQRDEVQGPTGALIVVGCDWRVELQLDQPGGAGGASRRGAIAGVDRRRGVEQRRRLGRADVDEVVDELEVGGVAGEQGHVVDARGRGDREVERAPAGLAAAGPRGRGEAP